MNLTVCDLLARAYQIAKSRWQEPEVSVQGCLWTAAAELGCTNTSLETGAQKTVEAVIRGIFGFRNVPLAGILDWYDDPHNPLRHSSSHDAAFILSEAVTLASWVQEPEQDRFRFPGDLPNPWTGDKASSTEGTQ